MILVFKCLFCLFKLFVIKVLYLNMVKWNVNDSDANITYSSFFSKFKSCLMNAFH